MANPKAVGRPTRKRQLSDSAGSQQDTNLPQHPRLTIKIRKLAPLEQDTIRVDTAAPGPTTVKPRPTELPPSEGMKTPAELESASSRLSTTDTLDEWMKSFASPPKRSTISKGNGIVPHPAQPRNQVQQKPGALKPLMSAPAGKDTDGEEEQEFGAAAQMKMPDLAPSYRSKRSSRTKVPTYNIRVLSGMAHHTPSKYLDKHNKDIYRSVSDQQPGHQAEQDVPASPIFLNETTVDQEDTTLTLKKDKNEKGNLLEETDVRAASESPQDSTVQKEEVAPKRKMRRHHKNALGEPKPRAVAFARPIQVAPASTGPGRLLTPQEYFFQQRLFSGLQLGPTMSTGYNDFSRGDHYPTRPTGHPYHTASYPTLAPRGASTTHSMGSSIPYSTVPFQPIPPIPFPLHWQQHRTALGQKFYVDTVTGITYLPIDTSRRRVFIAEGTSFEVDDKGRLMDGPEIKKTATKDTEAECPQTNVLDVDDDPA